MTMFLHELRRARVSCLIWAASIAAMVAVCLFMYPEMSGEMSSVSNMFAGMGAFTKAFGLDTVDFASPMGFYGIECGNVLGICGALFAALLGAGALAREETGRTAEFLLTHPVSRVYVAVSKLCACVFQVAIVNIASGLTAALCFAAIGEELMVSDFISLHIAMLASQIEIMCLCYLVSAFARRSAVGAGIGVMALSYFMGLLINISDAVKFLKYVTPFAYSDAAGILSGGIDVPLLCWGMVLGLVCAGAGVAWYRVKDIAA